MAEQQSGAQSKLGQLYVELGVKGLKSMLGGLNAVSAQFLLTKNAAEQFVKPIAGLSRNASSGILALEKLSAVSGMSVTNLANLQIQLKRNKVDFNEYINTLTNLQQRMNLARINKDPATLQAFQNLGINVLEMDPNKPQQVIHRVAQALKGLNGAQKAAALSLIGLSEEWVYMMDKVNQELPKNLRLTEEQTQKLAEQNDEWAKLDATTDSFIKKLAAELPIISDGIKAVTKVVENLIAFVDANREKKIDIVIDAKRKAVENFKHFIKGFNPFVNERGETVSRKEFQQNVRSGKAMHYSEEKANFITKLAHRIGTFQSDVWKEEKRRRGAEKLAKPNKAIDMYQAIDAGGSEHADVNPTPLSAGMRKPTAISNVYRNGENSYNIEVTNNITTNGDADSIVTGIEDVMNNLATTIVRNGIQLNNGVLQ